MLSHVDKNGKAKMVDVSEKIITFRKAYAAGSVYVGKKILNLIMENNIKKGDVLGCAKIAGILASKKVGELIPLCHPLNLTFSNIEFQYDTVNDKIIIFSETAVNAQTGVEMEALTGVNVAALTIYDMCKGVDKEIVIGESLLIKKTGGKSGVFRNKKKIKGYVKTDTVINSELALRKDLFIGIIPDFLENNDVLMCGDKKLSVQIYNNEPVLKSSERIEIRQGEEICLI